MNIISNLLIAMLLLFVAGFSLVFFTAAMKKGEFPEGVFWLLPSLGYVLLQFCFWLLYLIRGNSGESLFISCLIVILLLLLTFLLSSLRSKKYFDFSQLPAPRSSEWILSLVVLSVLIISSWQYLVIGQGNYYHSGNEDFFDGITGGEAYLNNVKMTDMQYDFSTGLPIQYSSQAFWRILLGIGGVDAFLIQALVNLFLTVFSVFWLSRYVFKFNNKFSVWISFWSVAANFYMTTYLNGHIGSLIYGSIAPGLIGIIILWSRREILNYWMIISLVILILLHFTYPGPVYFLLIPVGVLVFYQRVIAPNDWVTRIKNFLGKEQNKNYGMKWIRISALLLLILAVIAVSVWVVYDYFEPRRVNAILRTNVSWKISLYKEMIAIFWGIYPSGSTGVLSALPLLISNGSVNLTALFISILLTMAVFYFGVKSYRDDQKQYLFIYLFLFIPFFIIMRYFWGSPYYFYKFLYVNYFMAVVLFFYFIEHLSKKIKKQYLKRILLTAVSLLGILNLFWNVLIGLDYYFRPYNDNQKFYDFISAVDKKQIQESFIDIPNFLTDLTFKYIFKEHGFKTQPIRKNAKYLIQLNSAGNVYHNSVDKTISIYDNGILRLIEPPPLNLSTIKTLYEPEQYGKSFINWVGNEISIKKNILNNSIESVKNIFIKESVNVVYIDVYDLDIYSLIMTALQEAGIRITDVSGKAKFVIDIKGEKPILGNIGKQTAFWEDDFIKIISSPLLGKNNYADHSEYANQLEDSNLLYGVDLTGLIKAINGKYSSASVELGNRDRLQLRHSWVFFVQRYLKEYLYLHGLEIRNSQEQAELRCEIYLSDKESSEIDRTKNIWYSGKNLGNWGYLNILLRQESVCPAFSDNKITLESERQFNSNGEYQLAFSNVSRSAEYLRILVSPGPSIDFSPFNLRIITPLGKVEKNFRIENPMTLLDVRIEDFKEKNDSVVELFFEGIKLVGHSLLPLDDRYLNYQIRAVELTNQVSNYTDYMVQAFNSRTPSRLDRFWGIFGNQKKTAEIIPDTKSDQIFLGLGWYPLETYQGMTFRWVGASFAEIIIAKEKIKEKMIAIDLESGPGCGNKPLGLEVIVNNMPVQSYIIKGRKKISINVDNHLIENTGFLTIKLFPKTINAKISSDQRILNFRVFNIFPN